MFLLLLDGPFLQRASSVQIISQTNVTKLSIPVSPSPLLVGATGLITTSNSAEPDLYNPSFSLVAQGYNARVPISIPKLEEFPGIITMDLVAPGFDVSCINGSSSYRIQTLYDFNLQGSNCTAIDNGTDHGCIPGTQTMFKINIEYLAKRSFGQVQNGIFLQTFYKDTPEQNGTLSWRNCTLNEAIIRYPLKIDNGTVTLRPIPLGENRTQYLIFRKGEFDGNADVWPSTLGGLWIALKNQYQTSANVSIQPLISRYELHNENAIADQFFVGGDVMSYDVMWSDPTDVIIAAAHELALRTAINLTNISSRELATTGTQSEILHPNLTFVNRSISQEVTATMVRTGPVYRTDLGWLISGFVMILLAGLAVAPLYWAWWRLERSFTLNPFEVSKAFDAPLLRLANADLPSGAWSKDMKRMRIQYGTVRTTEELEPMVAKNTKSLQGLTIPNVAVQKFRKID